MRSKVRSAGLLGLVWVVLLCSSVDSWAKTAEYESYAGVYGVALARGGVAARVGLDSAVYAHMSGWNSTAPELGVYASSGEALPWRLVPRSRLAPESLWVDLAQVSAPGKIDEVAQTAVALQVQGSDQNVLLRWATAQAAPQSDSVWWLDVRGHRYTSLRLLVDSLSKFVAAAQLESSSDLVEWEPLVESAGVAAWNENGLRVRSLQVTVPDSAAFLRLTLRVERGTFHLQGVQGLRVLPGGEEGMRSVVLTADSVDSLGWIFRTTGPWPVWAARVEPMGDGAWGRGELQARAGDSLPWLAVAELDAYRWRNGDWLFLSDSAGWSKPVRMTQWRYRAKTPRAALGGAPRLRLWWSPDTVEFVAGGREQVLLTVGLHPARAGEAMDWQDSLPGIPTQATLGTYMELAGAKALQPPAFVLGRALLWGGLLLFLVLLLVMARKLWREMVG
jgi:hypothetical protein